MRWVKAVGLPLAYLAAVIWATRPPPPTYVAADKTVVTVNDANTPVLLHSPEAIYPQSALDARVEGTVTLNVTIDGEGCVSKAEAVRGPAALHKAAVDAVSQWQFTAVAAETEIQVPFLLWHPGPRVVTLPEPLTRVPAVTARGRHGKVRLVATVDAAGRVESAEPVSGPKRLLTAAVANVRQWTFRPATRDGKPDRGTAVVEVEF